MDYSLEIKNAVDNNIIQLEDVYDFRGTPLEELLSKYYVFCRENLDIHSVQETITPNILLFTNSFEVNAGAGLKNKCFVITINLGLLKFCIDNYHDNDELNNYFQALYPDTINKFDNPINILAFQICTQFTYYHELAHLFQLSSQHDEMTIQERNNKEQTDNFDRTKHILETNADIYASISITTHIERYISKTFKDEVTIENTFETLIVLCSCLLNYTLSFSEKVEEIYFDKYTHPHSFIRQLNAILNIVNHIEQSPYFKEKNIKINSNELFLKVLDVYKDLEKAKVFKTNVSDVIDNNKELSKTIINYLYSIIQFDLTEYVNAMDVWNKHIT